MKKLLIAMAAGALLLGALLAASGCGSQSAEGSGTELSSEKYAQLEEGMPSDQIIAIAGEPSKKEQKSTSGGHQMSGGTMDASMPVENWYYQGSKGWVRLEVSDGKLTSKSGY